MTLKSISGGNFFSGGINRERDRRTDGQTDRLTDGHNIFIAAGERSLYRDSGWIVSRIFLWREEINWGGEINDHCTG